MNNFPRRARIDLMTPEELALFNMIGEVEKLGAHPLLTDVVVLLGDARSKLADWVDLQSDPSPANENQSMDCRTALLTLLDQVDYTAGNCRPNEMVGAVLDKRVIALCRESAQPALAADTALPSGDCPFCVGNEPHLREHCYREIRRAAKA